MDMDGYDEKEIYEEKLREKHEQWWGSLDADTHELYQNILQYESEYFKDMLLKIPDLKKYTLGTDAYGNECYLADMFDLCFDLESDQYTYHIKGLDDCAGLCDSKDRSITFDPEYASDKATVLHEMVHAYENIIDSKKCPFIKEIILLYLYNKLRPQVTDLDDKIAAHANILSGMDILMQGGNHDILFFLKSLDLDLCCGYKPGTVCGYGRDKE